MSDERMTLLELEEQLRRAREHGAHDETPVLLSCGSRSGLLEVEVKMGSEWFCDTKRVVELKG